MRRVVLNYASPTTAHYFQWPYDYLRVFELLKAYNISPFLLSTSIVGLCWSYMFGLWCIAMSSTTAHPLNGMVYRLFSSSFAPLEGSRLPYARYLVVYFDSRVKPAYSKELIDSNVAREICVRAKSEWSEKTRGLILSRPDCSSSCSMVRSCMNDSPVRTEEFLWEGCARRCARPQCLTALPMFFGLAAELKVRLREAGSRSISLPDVVFLLQYALCVYKEMQ